jgi:hypothetical protein
MRILIAGIFGLLPFVGLAQTAQQQPPQQSHIATPSRDGGVREVLESIVISPIPNGVGIWSRRTGM